ncbi:MAG TPA: protein kinase [Opitutaceae bacterium]
MNRDEEIFTAALGVPTEMRAGCLLRLCPDDAACRGRVSALLRSHDRSGDFLRLPLAVLGTTAQGESSLGRIGRYLLLEKIGEGGCGVVYLAEQQEPVRRRVALKVIKLGMDTQAVVARFEAERQALALMDHPNIARVFDAGASETGRPYFVMELVRGLPITKFCAQKKLPLRKRLELFTPVCAAVHHAHQKGIVHRDLKPSNLLVAESDGTPIPKVIDFGVAKATQGRLTEHTLFTTVEQFIGTPVYMSPEQAELSGVEVNTRSDIYSLGVVLYELLVGLTPFDAQEFATAGIDEVRRQIREVDPPLPSARLRTLKAPEAADLAAAVRGDLDSIVMRSLEKDRARRYATAQELAQDLDRFLRHEPVHARPRRLGYVAGKFAWRRRRALAFAAVAAVAIALGAWQWIRAGHDSLAPSDSAAAQMARARSVIDSVNYTEADLALAESEAARATELAPDSGDAWALRGYLEACFVLRTWDLSEKRLQAAEKFCNRALALNPNQTEAMLGLATVQDFQGAWVQAEAVMRKAIQLRPDDPRLYRRLGLSIVNSGHRTEGIAVLQENVRRFPQDWLSWYDLALGYGDDIVPPSLAAFQRSAELSHSAGAYAHIIHNRMLHDDIPGAEAAYAQVPVNMRSEDRFVSMAMWMALLEDQPERAIQSAGMSTSDYISDSLNRGPKAFLVALADEMAHRPASEKQAWDDAATVLRSRLQNEQLRQEPTEADQLFLGIALAWNGQKAEAAAIIAPIEARERESSHPTRAAYLCRYYAGLGDSVNAVFFLGRARLELRQRALIDPWLMRIRGNSAITEFAAEIAHAH